MVEDRIHLEHVSFISLIDWLKTGKLHSFSFRQVRIKASLNASPLTSQLHWARLDVTDLASLLDVYEFASTHQSVAHKASSSRDTHTHTETRVHTQRTSTKMESCGSCGNCGCSFLYIFPLDMLFQPRLWRGSTFEPALRTVFGWLAPCDVHARGRHHCISASQANLGIEHLI